MKRHIPRAGGMCGLLAALVLVSPAHARPLAPSQDGCPPSSSSDGPPQPNELGHPLNYVLAENCHSGTQQLHSALQVARADGQRDQPTNLAYAYSHDCASGCESIAVAYQVVLVNNNSSSQAPQNAAVAINDNCSGCATFGYADQYAVDVPPGTHLSPRARSQLGQIAQQANQDIRAGMPFSELDSDLKSLAGQLQQDVDNDLAQQNVPAHHPHDSQTTTEHGAPGSPPTG